MQFQHTHKAIRFDTIMERTSAQRKTGGDTHTISGTRAATQQSAPQRQIIESTANRMHTDEVPSAEPRLSRCSRVCTSDQSMGE